MISIKMICLVEKCYLKNFSTLVLYGVGLTGLRELNFSRITGLQFFH